MRSPAEEGDLKLNRVGQRRSTFFGDLRTVLAGRDFRRLFAVRLMSQTGDGIITAGVGTYVFFNASTFPNPAAGAAAFAALYVPYSLIGPFAGVFIDRWSRRQILVWSALLRSTFVVLTAALMAAGSHGPPLYIAVLLVLGVNRFFLSSLSAALPHVVAGDELVMANSVSPTAGGIMAIIGGLVALGLNVGHRQHRARRRASPCWPGAPATWRPAWSRPPCGATCSGRCVSPASRRRGGWPASWPRSRPGWPRARGTSSGGAARRRRSA